MRFGNTPERTIAMSETRDAYVKKMKAKLDEWNAEIAKLEAKAKQKEADAQQSYEKQIDELKEKRGQAKDRLDQMRQAGETAWDDLKAGIEQATTALGEAVRSAQSRFQ
jgi:hypothetical protein